MPKHSTPMATPPTKFQKMRANREAAVGVAMRAMLADARRVESELKAACRHGVVPGSVRPMRGW